MKEIQYTDKKKIVSEGARKPILGHLLQNAYFLYSCLFFILLPVVFLPFITGHKTFVWYVDGMSQHFPMFQYYGGLLKDFIAGKGFPLVDTTLGLGFDTITTLHYYVLGDPLTLLSIFCTPENAVYLYSAMILLRLYLVGISFIVFASYWNKTGIPVILGALIYTFCGFSFFGGLRHPYFLNPMIYLPLLFIGIEQVLRRKKPYLLITMVFVSTISNFYFSYILTIIAAVYVIYRFFTGYRKTYSSIISGFMVTVLRIGGCYLLGFSLSAFLFLPVIYAFLTCGRQSDSQQSLIGYFHYNIEYYGSLLQSVFSSGTTPGYWVFLSFPAITAVSLTIMLCNRRFSRYRMAFILCCLALFVPAFGYVMNGFSYVTNRWSFFVSFFVAVIFVVTYDHIFQLKKSEIIILLTGVTGYFVLAHIGPDRKQVTIECYALLLNIIIILILQNHWFKRRKWIQESILAIMILFCLGFHGYTYYSPQFNGYADEFLTKAEIDKQTYQGALSLIRDIEDSSFYRIETYGDSARNEALILGYNDVSAYFSMLDGNITTYFQQLELLDQKNSYRFDSFDTRTIMAALANVKYFVTTTKNAVPYGYQLAKEEHNGSETYYLYENLYALPLGYTYDSYMLEEDYNKLNSLEKQNSMMSSVILSQSLSQIPETTPYISTGIQKLTVQVTPSPKIKMGQNVIKVGKSGGSLLLEFLSPSNSETYIRLSNFSLSRKAATMTTLNSKAEHEAKKSINIRSIYHNTYFGKKDYLINTGFSDQVKTKATIKFPKKETYHYDSIDVYSLNMNVYTDQVQKLSETTLSNTKMDHNKVEGNITMNSNGVLLLSIPYSKGWSAYVDGAKTTILRGNIMYMALPLETGEHQITLHYTTPYLKTGAIISVISLVVFIGIIIFGRFANTKNSPAKRDIRSLLRKLPK